MMTSIVADEVVQALRDFLLTGFKPSNPELADVIDDFLSEPANLARGQYLSLSLPFRKSPGAEPFPPGTAGLPALPSPAHGHGATGERNGETHGGGDGKPYDHIRYMGIWLRSSATVRPGDGE